MYGSLHIIEPGKAERVFELKGTASLGRTAENDITLNSEGVLPRHALLLVRSEGVVLVVLGGANGTFVNGVQALPQGQIRLKDGDLITIGRVSLRYDGPRVSAVGPQRTAGALDPGIATRLPARTRPQRPRQPYAPIRDGRNRPRADGKPIDPGRYLRYLPGLYHDDDLLDRFLRGCEDLLGPIERVIGDLEDYVNPRLAPEELLPWLAFWVGVSFDARWPVERRRPMIMEAATLYPWRGTKRGLRRAIQLATGYEPEIVEPQARAGGRQRRERWHLFQVVLRVPDPAAIDRALVESIVEAQKPAHTAYLLEIVKAEAGAPVAV
jgi:phage tail-like protein